jgi:hypothetical protein
MFPKATYLDSMNTLAISVRSASRFFAYGERIVRVRLVSHALIGVRERREVGGGAVAIAENSRAQSAVARGVACTGTSGRTVLDGVIFFLAASDFNALRVSLSPFASRYASTAGTRSAAAIALRVLMAQLSECNERRASAV